MSRDMNRMSRVNRDRQAGMTLIEVIIGSALLAVITLAILMVTIPITRLSSDTGVALDMDSRARTFFGHLRPLLRQSGFGSGGVVDPTSSATSPANSMCFQIWTWNAPAVASYSQIRTPGAMYFLDDTGADLAHLEPIRVTGQPTVFEIRDGAHVANVDFNRITFRRRLRPGDPGGRGGAGDTDVKADDNDWSAKIRIYAEDVAGRIVISQDTVNGAGGVLVPKQILEASGVFALRFLDGDGNGAPTLDAFNADGSIQVLLTLERANPNRGQAAEGDVVRRTYIDRVAFMNRQ